MKKLIISLFSTSILGMGVGTLPMTLQPVNSNGGYATCMAMTPQCMGNSAGTRPADQCLECNDRGPYNHLGGFRMGMQYPWWYSYGNFGYPNFRYPGYWYNGGLSNQYYPGPGNMAAGKPNLYFHGTDKELENARFKINFKGKSNMLAASPIHGEDGWSVNFKDGKLKVANTEYDYIYYDYKLYSGTMQSERGFCGDRKTIYNGMVKLLVDMEFKDKEIKDFESYWSLKIPRGDFCVYPQGHDELQQSAQWNSSIAPAYFKRILFVLVPKEQVESKTAAHFNKVPKESWNPMSAVYRLPASKNTFQVHEWGVAFLTKK